MKKRDISILIAPLFLIIVALALIALSRLSSSTADEQLTLTENAVRRCAVECYAIEGSYPEELDYIVSQYGLTYDRERFFIHYKHLGSNLMPEIKVFPLTKSGGS